MTKSKHHPALADFSNKDTTFCSDKNTEILTKNETKDSTGNKSKPMSANEAKIRELENEIESLRHRMDAINAKLSENKNGRKREKNKHVVYIRDEIYPTYKKFRDSPNEPLKVTIKKIFAAAEKYLELTGVQNNMSLFNHQKTLQENLES